MTDDPVQARLLELIRSKAKGRKKPAKAAAPKVPPPDTGNVVSIMDALRKSIASDSRRKKS